MPNHAQKQLQFNGKSEPLLRYHTEGVLSLESMTLLSQYHDGHPHTFLESESTVAESGFAKREMSERTGHHLCRVLPVSILGCLTRFDDLLKVFLI